jgi:DNA-binding transcriptional LysR family regulator
LDTALFIREHSGLRLTFEGNEFIARSKAILNHGELMHSTLQQRAAGKLSADAM